MVKDTAGVWTVTTDSISEGFHYYSLLIDGVAVADPASQTFYGMGRMASGIEIPFAGGGILCNKRCTAWRYPDQKIFFQSHQFMAAVYIYTPPGYDSNINEKYPVLYILHGGGEDQTGWATQGKTDLDH